MTTLTQELAKRGCLTIQNYKKVKKAVKKLATNRVGALPVKNISGEIVGIVSERDIVKGLHIEKSKLFSHKVESIMSKPVISCSLNARANDLMETMTKNKIRHIPIIENQNLLGIVSIGDVVNRLIEKYKTEAEYMKEYINS
ncbi:MAG: CBS domain-containing protein [Pseudomonadota bacterium]|nr:CBS domain-containing protein [Pseudomonadota bacterium]